jgi:hypothetical protein
MNHVARCNIYIPLGTKCPLSSGKYSTSNITYKIFRYTKSIHLINFLPYDKYRVQQKELPNYYEYRGVLSAALCITFLDIKHRPVFDKNGQRSQNLIHYLYLTA